MAYKRLCGAVRTAHRHTPKQIPIGFCILDTGLGVVLGQCKCTIGVIQIFRIFIPGKSRVGRLLRVFVSYSVKF